MQFNENNSRRYDFNSTPFKQNTLPLELFSSQKSKYDKTENRNVQKFSLNNKSNIIKPDLCNFSSFFLFLF